MPEIPVAGFVLEALGATALGLILRSFEEQQPRAGVRDWSLGLWTLAAALIASIAAVHAPPGPALRPALLALAVVLAYWSPALVLLGTWARWHDREPGRLRTVLLAVLAVVGVVTSLAVPATTWGSPVRFGVRTLATAASLLTAGLLLLRARSGRRLLGARVLAVSFLGQALENAFFVGVTVARSVGASLPMRGARADPLVEAELLLLILSGVGMVAWLLEEEREAAVRLEESLRRRETLSAMGALVAGVAHEVRNPLFGISASLDAFEARFGFQDAAGPYLTAMRAQVQRMGQLMTELLEYGRPIGSAFAEEPLGDVLQEAVQSCAALAVQSDVTVEADPNAGALLVPMDRPRLVQVFQNLIQNAVEHTPRGSRVLVGVKTEELHGRLGVQCAIRDFGPGFGSSDLPRIFDPFFTRRRGGTGLGLSIVRRIVQQHSGDVQAANHPEGGGVVSVWLPVADPSDLARSDRNVTRA